MRLSHNDSRGRQHKSLVPRSLVSVSFGWLLGVMMGSIGTAFFIAKNQDQAPLANTTPTLAAANKSAVKGRKATATIASKAAQPKFDFYTILSSTETVDSGPTTTEVLAANVSPEPKTTEEADSTYILQIASFKSMGEAEDQKARLALLGIQVGIEKVRLNGDTWFRVRQGPINSLAKAEELQKQLQAQHVNSLRLKLRSDGDDKKQPGTAEAPAVTDRG